MVKKKKMQHQTKKNQRVLVWMWLPGYVNTLISANNSMDDVMVLTTIPCLFHSPSGKYLKYQVAILPPRGIWVWCCVKYFLKTNTMSDTWRTRGAYISRKPSSLLMGWGFVFGFDCSVISWNISFSCRFSFPPLFLCMKVKSIVYTKDNHMIPNSFYFDK